MTLEQQGKLDPRETVRQLSLLMPLDEAIRAQLTGKEFVGFRRTENRYPYIEVRTEQGANAIAYIEEDLYVLEAGGDKVACHPAAVREAIDSAISRILDSARGAQKQLVDARMRQTNDEEVDL